jgi:hypothetical protein
MKSIIKDNELFSVSALPINQIRQLSPESYSKFISKLDSWIHSSNQKIQGLPSNKYLTAGITDVLDKTYINYEKIGIFPGEYSYHALVLEESRLTYDLASADIIIVSHPFSATGNGSDAKLFLADAYNVPILVDCAYFGVCSNINFDFTRFKNIRSVAFSLSKTFGTGNHRLGLLYTNDFYPYEIWNEWGYQYYPDVELHSTLLDTLSPDDTVTKFKKVQIEVCNKYRLLPSDTVLFGLDYGEDYKGYKRDFVNRLCLSYFYAEHKITAVQKIKKQLDKYFYKIGYKAK